MLKPIDYEDDLAVDVQLLNIKNYPLHNHKAFQIFYVLEGELTLQLFYAKYRLHPGSIHIVHTEDVHSIETITENNLVLVLSFDSAYFQSVFPHFITTVFITNIEENSFAKADVLRDRIFSIVAEYNDRSHGFAGRINSAAVTLINTLMNNFRGFVVDPSEKVFIHKVSHDYMQVDRISRIIQYVYENYPYKISLSDLAEKEQISPYYLSHVFHKLVGMNFRDFLNMVRVEMSETAVLSTRRSITQIAQDVGFSDAKYYVSHFHKYLGYHPKEYRRLFSDKVYGSVMPDVEEYPLTRLEDIIDRYTEYPVFKDKAIEAAAIEVDFAARPSSTFRHPPAVFFNFDDIYPDIRMGDGFDGDPAKIYQDVNAQQFAIDILSAYAEKPSGFHMPEMSLFDVCRSGGQSLERNGLLAVNGLKNPIYYLLELINKLPDDVIDAGPNYIVLRGASERFLLVFNPDDTKSATIEIITRNVDANYKLTKYQIRADKSCLDFWAQLNFSTRLTRKDIENINHMSSPFIEFEIVSRLEQYYASVYLAPLDILLMEFTRDDM